MSRKWLLLTVLGFSTFLAAISNNIAIILPLVEEDIGISTLQSQWLMLAYFIGLCVCVLPMGRLGDMFGYRLIFLTGSVVMLAASLLLSVVSTYMLLLLARILMGIGAAMALAVGPAIISLIFSAQEKGKALGWQSVLTYAGQSFTPVFGGYIGFHWGWQSLFYVNIPLILLLFLGGFWLIPKQALGKKVPLDGRGLIYFILALSSFVLILNGVGLSEWQLAVLALLFLAGALLFFRTEMRQLHPMINLKLFRIPAVSYGAVGVIANYLCFALAVFLMPYFFERVSGLSVAAAGVIIGVLPVMMLIISPLSGTISDRIGFRIPTMAGMFCIAVGLLMLSFSGGGTPIAFIAAAMALTGLGLGLFVAPNNAAILNGTPKPVQGLVSGLIGTSRYVGWMFGVSLGGTFLTGLTEMGNMPTTESYLFAFQVTMWMGVLVALAGMYASWRMGVKQVPQTTEGRLAQ